MAACLGVEALSPQVRNMPKKKNRSYGFRSRPRLAQGSGVNASRMQLRLVKCWDPRCECRAGSVTFQPLPL